MNPVALLTRIGPDDRDPNSSVKVRYCAGCFMFHPVRCFHRDRTRKSGYRYVCKAFRSETRPTETGNGRNQRRPRDARKRTRLNAQGALFV